MTCPALVRVASTEAVLVGPLSPAGEQVQQRLGDVRLKSGIRKVVSPLKDVEGLHFKFHYNLYHK